MRARLRRVLARIDDWFIDAPGWLIVPLAVIVCGAWLGFCFIIAAYLIDALVRVWP